MQCRLRRCNSLVSACRGQSPWMVRTISPNSDLWLGAGAVQGNQRGDSSAAVVCRNPHLHHPSTPRPRTVHQMQTSVEPLKRLACKCSHSLLLCLHLMGIKQERAPAGGGGWVGDTMMRRRTGRQSLPVLSSLSYGFPLSGFPPGTLGGGIALSKPADMTGHGSIRVDGGETEPHAGR